MKTKIKLSAILFAFAAFLFSVNTSVAQCWANSHIFSFPPTDELQSQQGTLAIMQGNNSSSPGAPALIGLGINTLTPAYQLDVLCDPAYNTNNDINISMASGAQNSAYRIGGNRVLWYNGEIRNIYVGVGAGNANIGIYQNTFVGGNAGINFSRL